DIVGAVPAEQMLDWSCGNRRELVFRFCRLDGGKEEVPLRLMWRREVHENDSVGRGRFSRSRISTQFAHPGARELFQGLVVGTSPHVVSRIARRCEGRLMAWVAGPGKALRRPNPDT